MFHNRGQYNQIRVEYLKSSWIICKYLEIDSTGFYFLFFGGKECCFGFIQMCHELHHAIVWVSSQLVVYGNYKVLYNLPLVHLHFHYTVWKKRVCGFFFIKNDLNRGRKDNKSCNPFIFTHQSTALKLAHTLLIMST